MTTENPKFFFSYSREDSVFVLKLARELREAGATLWLDRLDIRGGQRWDEAVQAALKSCEGMLAVLSPRSVASINFMDEVSYAIEEQKQIIPVLYQECTIPFRLRRVQYVDFRSAYSDGFAETLRALGLDDKPTEAGMPSVIERHDPGKEILYELHEGERRYGTVDEQKPAVDAEPTVSTFKPHRQSFGQRIKGALIGAAGGSIAAAILSLFGGGDWTGYSAIAAFFGIFGTIAGLIVGMNRRVSIIVAVTCLSVPFAAGLIFKLNSSSSPAGEVWFISYFFGLPLSSIVGAVGGTIFDMVKRRS